jgi:hypothetical protein
LKARQGGKDAELPGGDAFVEPDEVLQDAW